MFTGMEFGMEVNGSGMFGMEEDAPHESKCGEPAAALFRGASDISWLGIIATRLWNT